MVSSTATTQTSIVGPSSYDTSRQHAIFNEFLKWYEDHQIFSSTPSVALTCTSFAGLTHSTSLGPCVLDSSVIDHIIVNKYFFSSLSTTGITYHG